MGAFPAQQHLSCYRCYIHSYLIVTRWLEYAPVDRLNPGQKHPLQSIVPHGLATKGELIQLLWTRHALGKGCAQGGCPPNTVFCAQTLDGLFQLLCIIFLLLYFSFGKHFFWHWAQVMFFVQFKVLMVCRWYWGGCESYRPVCSRCHL